MLKKVAQGISCATFFYLKIPDLVLAAPVAARCIILRFVSGNPANVRRSSVSQPFRKDQCLRMT